MGEESESEAEETRTQWEENPLDDPYFEEIVTDATHFKNLQGNFEESFSQKGNKVSCNNVPANGDTIQNNCVYLLTHQKWTGSYKIWNKFYKKLGCFICGVLKVIAMLLGF